MSTGNRTDQSIAYTFQWLKMGNIFELSKHLASKVNEKIVALTHFTPVQVLPAASVYVGLKYLPLWSSETATSPVWVSLSQLQSVC